MLRAGLGRRRGSAHWRARLRRHTGQLSLAPNAEVGVYDDQDRLSSYGSSLFFHSANGERSQTITSGLTSTFTHDDRGSLRQVTLVGGATTVDYQTDPSGHRIERKVNGTITHRWIYRDGLRIAAELDASGAVVSRFLYAGGHVPALMVKGGETYRLVTD